MRLTPHGTRVQGISTKDAFWRLISRSLVLHSVRGERSMSLQCVYSSNPFLVKPPVLLRNGELRGVAAGAAFTVRFYAV